MSGRTVVVVIIAGLVLFVCLTCVVWYSVSFVVSSWFESISDPTERGLAYVAVAIGMHALVQIVPRVNLASNANGASITRRSQT